MFFDYEKKYLQRKMKAAQNYSDSIKLDWIYCQIGVAPANTFSAYWSCECSDPRLTGFGSDELYKIYSRDGLINKSVAYGFMTEQVYYATLKFKESVFVYYEFSDKKPYSMQYPKREWEVLKSRNYSCKKCGLKHIESSYNLIEQYHYPICDGCNTVMSYVGE